MNNDQINAVRALAKCTFQPGSADKRFIQQLSRGPIEVLITDAQHKYLFDIFHRYRKQHKQKCFCPKCVVKNF